MKKLQLRKRLRSALRPQDHLVSYSQCGEDLILHFLFSLLQIPHPTYLDIGAHHPSYLSNTYLFYTEGAKGVCVEPNPLLHQNIQAKRPRDTCLNIGIIAAGGSEALNFYVFDDTTMSTFSETIKNEQQATGKSVKQTLLIRVMPVNEVISSHFQTAPNLVSLDTEGLDLAILETFRFDLYRPEVFCIETLTNVAERKMSEIIDFMLSQGYTIYADTYVNTIFVENGVWARRRNEALK